MEDFGEYTPLDSRSANGMDGTEMHNLYPVQYHCAAWDFSARQRRPLARFQRSGYTGAAPCAQIVWGGDPTTSFGFDGLRSAVTNALTMGLSGISTWGSDIGGFFALGATHLSPELLKRWVQFGAVSGVMRTQANGIAIPSKDRPQIWDEDQIGNWRRYAKLRTQLYPYLVAADRDYRRTGLPIMRHLMLAYPNDSRAAAADTEFLFGPDLLAAPVVDEGVTTREVYLPRGRWVDLWRSVRYRAAGDGGLRLGAAKLLRGKRDRTLPAPLNQLPLLARAGAILPLLPPDVDTLTSYGDGSDQVSLGDRADELELLAFPRGRSSSRFLNGGRLVSREREHRWSLRVDSGRKRHFELQASLKTLRRKLVPCAVSVGGHRLPKRAWSFDRKRRVLRASFALEDGKLSVRSCRGSRVQSAK
jgi:alpha-glucosidase (family GH31 glycosyl hydrolase)